MIPYPWVVALHVISVMCCAGPVLVLAVAADGVSAPASQRLVRIASIGLLGVLVTGVGAIALTGGGLAESWWMRLSVLLFLIIGALTGRLRAVLRKGSPSAVRPLAWTITVALALVVYLMEAKPI
jgi:hypothetical protein